MERRNHKRYVVKQGAYAASQPTATTIGPIIDISMGGLLFKYIFTNILDNEFSESLFLLGSLKHYTNNILFKIIDDFDDTNYPLSKSMQIRKRRIKFEDLSDSQRLELQHYIHGNS